MSSLIVVILGAVAVAGVAICVVIDLRYQRALVKWQKQQKRKRQSWIPSYAEHYKSLYGTPPFHRQQITHQQDLIDQQRLD